MKNSSLTIQKNSNIDKEEKLRKVIRSLDNCYVKVKKTANDSVVVNIEQEEFFCDTFSLKDVIQLIALMELFFSTILIIISFDHIFPHGYQLFFIENRDIITKNLGIYLFLVQFCGSLFNIISIICLFWGIKKSKAFYLIPHIIWQIFYIGTSLLLTTCVMYLVMRRTMLRGSAEAFLFMIMIPLTCQIYFISLFGKFFCQLRKNEKINNLLKSNCVQNLNSLLSNGLLEFSMERERKRTEMMKKKRRNGSMDANRKYLINKYKVLCC